MTDKFKHLNRQQGINILNFIVAVCALILALPSAINQINEITERSKNITTVVLNYSPPNVDINNALDAKNCIGSAVSFRGDAYRCFGSGNNGVYDPCFWEEKYIGQAKDYFYCPADWKTNKDDKLFSVNSISVERRYFDVESVKERASKVQIPWLINLESGQSCRSVSGALDVAYGDKGDTYACNDKEYSSVTEGQVKGDKYYFQCKKSSETVFKDCLATVVVF